MFEYKVISQRDATFSGSFDLDALARTLNSHAADGWRLVEGFTAGNVMKALKTEIVVVFERPVAG